MVLDDEEDDVLAPKEPQLTSENPEERKAARALRIKKRLEALKRTEQQQEEVVPEEAPGLIEQATSTAAEELQRLALDGAAKVTNVKVTTDEREVIRRALFSNNMKKSLENIETEATEAQLQYEAITENWNTMLKIIDPLDINEAIKEQKQKCDTLLEQKNALIEEMKDDLKNMDKAYYEDLATQDQDIKELSERIEKQVTIMQRAYERQLYLIEQAINIEREAMVDHNNRRWEALYKQRDKEEISHMETKFEQTNENKEEIETIMWDHHDKYREAKIELESLIQELQKELEKLKAVCIINTEKIGYNYQILKKREEENVFVRSQQKRKLNKMSDVANLLRNKIRKAAEEGAAEEVRADAEIAKLVEMMGDLEKKANHFSQVNDNKFNQVWRMSSVNCAELVQEIRRAETDIHAYVLAEPPPIQTQKIPQSPLKMHNGTSKLNEENECLVTDDNEKLLKEAKEKLVKHILQLISDNTGFLVEDRLLKLIEKYNQSSRNLCTLDAIFMALEIEAEEDINLLCETFLQYAFCPSCTSVDECSDEERMDFQPSSHGSIVGRIERKSIVKGRASIIARSSMSASTSRSVGFRGQELSASDQMLLHEADEIMQKYGEPQVGAVMTLGSSAGDVSVTVSTRRGARGVMVADQSKPVFQKNNPFLCPVGHELEIEPVEALHAVGEFVSVFVPSEKEKLNSILDSVKTPDFTTPSRRLKHDDLIRYWTEWKKMFSTEKDRFWDGLLTGLNNYLNILQEREKLHADVTVLREKNAALRRLVRGALPEATPAPEIPAMFTASAPDTAPGLQTRLPRI